MKQFEIWFVIIGILLVLTLGAVFYINHNPLKVSKNQTEIGKTYAVQAGKDIVKIINNETKEITIKNNAQTTSYAKFKLISNTPICGYEAGILCQAIIDVSIYQDLNSNPFTKIRFLNKLQNVIGLDFDLEYENGTITTTYPKHGQNCTTLENSSLSCHTVQNGTYSITKPSYANALSLSSIPKGNYTLRLSSKNKSWKESVDWRVSFNDTELDEWAWWDSGNLSTSLVYSWPMSETTGFTANDRISGANATANREAWEENSYGFYTHRFNLSAADQFNDPSNVYAAGRNTNMTTPNLTKISFGNGTEYTIAAEINFTRGWANVGTIWSRSDQLIEGRLAFGDGGYIIYYDSGGAHYFNAGDPGSFTASFFGPHTFVFVFYATNLTMYIDGKFNISESIDLVDTPTDVTGLTLGESAAYGYYWSDMQMREFSIWTRPLSESDIISWNNSIYETSTPTINIVLYNLNKTYPGNSYNNSGNITLNATLSATNANLKNATFYVWNNSGSLMTSFSNTTLAGTEEYLNMTIPIQLPIGYYRWNVFGCTDTDLCNISSLNYTFYIEPLYQVYPWYTSNNLADSLVYSWAMNESSINILNERIQGNNATAHNNQPAKNIYNFPVTRFDLPASLQFNNSNDVINSGNYTNATTPILTSINWSNSTPMTIAAEINFTRGHGGLGVIFSTDYVSGPFQMIFSDAGDMLFKDNYDQYYFDTSFDGSYVGLWNTPHTFVWIFNPTNLTMYIDGIWNQTLYRNKSTAFGQLLNLDFGEMTAISGRQNWADMQMREFSIWSKALTEPEIVQWNNSIYSLTNVTSNYTPPTPPTANQTVEVILRAPPNGYTDTVLHVDFEHFNATIIPNNTNLTNATFNMWYTNGTFFNTTYFPLSGSNRVNISSGVYLKPDNYTWNVLGCIETGECKYAPENFTLNISQTFHNLTVTLISPPDGITTQQTSVMFIYGAAGTNLNVTNISVFFWYPNDTLFFRTDGYIAGPGINASGVGNTFLTFPSNTTLKWNALASASGGGENHTEWANDNYTITLNQSFPIVNLFSPTGIYTIYYIPSNGTNLLLNWSLSGPLASSCWYSFVPLTSTCFQETANLATSCGGLGTGTYSVNATTSNAVDGDHATSSINPTFYVNYTKPDHATNITTWTIYYNAPLTGFETSNTVNMPTACDNKNLTLRVRSAFSGTPIEYMECYNDTEWIQAGVITTTDSTLRVREEAVTWKMNSNQSTFLTCTDNSTTFNPLNYTSITFYANDTYNSVGYAITNWSYVLQQDGLSYSPAASGGQNILYGLNVTTANGYLPNATLVFNNTRYASDRQVSGNQIFFTTNIDIPIISVAQSIPFYWEIYTTNSSSTYYFNSTGANTTITVVNFGLCNGFDLVYPFINFTFKDEDNLSYMGARIDASTWNYWIGSGAVYNTYLFSNFTQNPSYAFCFEPGNATMFTTATVQFSAPGYPQRRYATNSQAFTNTTSNIVLYLLSSSTGIYTTIQVLSSGNQQIPGVTLQLERQFNGIWTLVSQGTTDDAGTATFWVNPNYDLRITATKTGFGSTVKTIRPTQSTYTLYLATSQNVTYSNTLNGVSWTTAPRPGELVKGNVYNFQFNITASLCNLVEYHFNITNKSGYGISSAKGISSCGSNLSILLNVSNYPDLHGFYYINTGNGSQLVDPNNWFLTDILNTGLSLRDFLLATADTAPEGLDDRGKIFLFFLIFTIVISALAYYTQSELYNPGTLIVVLTLIIIIFAYGGWFQLSWTPNTNNVFWEFGKRWAIFTSAFLTFLGYWFHRIGGTI